MPVTAVVFPTLDGRDPDAEGTIVNWLIEEGAWVHAGDLVAEVRVGRTSGQVAAPADGSLQRVAAEGQRIRQGAVVAILD